MKTYAEKQKLPSLQELADGLCEDKEDEIEYVITKKEQASLKKIEVGEATSIFTKLREYPYEFEINSRLQLASINGVKINDDASSTLQEKVNTLSAKVEELSNTVNNLQGSIDSVKSIIDKVGETKTVTNTITATVRNLSTICSLDLTEWKIYFIWNGV